MRNQRLLVVLVVVLVTSMLAACGPTPGPQVVEKEVTKVVKETVEVEKAVTQVVVQTVEVEKEVVQTVEVEVTSVPEGPPYGGTLVVALTSDPSSLNPLTICMDETAILARNWGDTLTERGPDLAPKPGLAESWEVSSDGKTYTFHLAEGVKWHDGTDFTSADAKFSLDFARTDGCRAGNFASIASVDTPDDQTLVIQLTDPNAALLGYLSEVGAFMLPAHLNEGTDMAGNPFSKAPVGTGPFGFEEWVLGDHVTFVANEDYYRGRPLLDKLIFKIIPDMETQRNAFDAGEVGLLLNSLGALDVPLYMQTANVYVAPMPVWWRIQFNMGLDKFSDANVRHAIAHAIDVPRVVEGAWFNVSPPATNASPMPKAVAWAYTDDVAAYPHDPAKAEELLDAAGYPRGADGIRFKTKFEYADWNPAWADTGILLKEMLAEVGIDLELQLIDTPTWLEKATETHDLEIVNHGGGIFEPDGLRQYYACGAYWNAAQYCNPEVDRLLDEGVHEVDPAKRAEIYYQVAKIIAEDLPGVTFTALTYNQTLRPEFGGGDAEIPHNRAFTRIYLKK